MAFAVTAVAAAIEVTTVASVLSAISAVGLATSVVGVVTGKPNLIKIGGELGLVGGIGGLVNGAVNGAAGNLAGVAEGATEGAYSDVAGEKFALASGTDAAGSGFGSAAADAVKSAAADGMGNIGSAAQDAFNPSSTGQNFDSVIQNNPDLIDITKQPSGAPSITGQLGGNAGTDIATNANGTYTGAPTPLADAATPSLPNGSVTPQIEASDVAMINSTPGATMTDLQSIKDKIGKAWDGLSPQGKAEMLKAALAIPGGIQAQKNAQRANDINQQRVNQMSYGSAVPTFGIIAKAQKGG